MAQEVSCASTILKILKLFSMKVGSLLPTCLGINNQFLCYPGEINAFVVRKIDQDCPDDYIFKRIHSPLIRIRPGQSRDTAWARLPKIGEAVEPNH
jgi:hypothetical protein